MVIFLTMSVFLLNRELLNFLGNLLLEQGLNCKKTKKHKKTKLHEGTKFHESKIARVHKIARRVNLTLRAKLTVVQIWPSSQNSLCAF